MNKQKDFDNIFDECLERLLEGESVEACLESYPEHAAALEPLLRTAAQTRDAADVSPRPEFRDRAAREFQEAIRLMPEKKSWWQGFAFWRTGWATAVTAVVVLLLAGGGTVAAAQNSLPDSPLYAVKLATEDARLWLATSDIGKAELYARFADERVEEIVAMAEKGDVAGTEKATGRMDEQLVAVSNLIMPETVATTEWGMLSAPTAVDSQKSLRTPTTTTTKAAMTTTATMTQTMTTSATTTVPQTAGGEPVPENGAVLPGHPEPVPTVTIAEDTLVYATSERGGSESYDGDLSDEEIANNRLRDKLAEQSLNNAQEIVNLLAEAPESMRPALERALEVANNGYWNAIRNIDISNSNIREQREE